MIFASIQGIPLFIAYLCLGIVLLTGYAIIYSRMTSHDEMGLIAAGNGPAALAFGLSMLGFALPVASAIGHAASMLDCLVWGIIGLLVQVLVYVFARWRFPDLSDRIAGGEWAVAIWLGLLSLTVGLINAVSMAG